MPTSTWVHTSDVQQIVVDLCPRSILDIGVGYGKWGVLFRDVLDIIKGRWERPEWKTMISGVEPSIGYNNPIYRYVYDEIRPVTFQTFCEAVARSTRNWHWDMIWIGDVLEHMEYEEVELGLKQLAGHYNFLLAGIPVGDKWPQGAVNGNELERHRTVWDINTVFRFGGKFIKYYPVGRRQYAIFGSGSGIDMTRALSHVNGWERVEGAIEW